MELWQAIMSRRSVRAFLPDPVGEAELAKLLQALAWAPSPLNLQPWSVVAVSDPAQKEAIRAAAEAAKAKVAMAGGPGWAAKYGTEFLTQAPLVLAVAYDPAKGGLGGYFSQPFGALSAVAAGIQNLMLAAAEMGLGSLWFTFCDPAELRPVLGIPDKLELAGIIPLGRPDGEVKAPPRKPVTLFWQRMA